MEGCGHAAGIQFASGYAVSVSEKQKPYCHVIANRV